MTATVPDWPEFVAPVLRDVAAEFRRRRKALRYHARHFFCGQDFSETATGSSELLTLDYEGLPGLQLRLCLWEDGLLWLRACLRRAGRNQGWAFCHHFYADWRGVAPAELVAKFEATLLSCSGAGSAGDSAGLRALWRAEASSG